MRQGQGEGRTSSYAKDGKRGPTVINSTHGPSSIEAPPSKPLQVLRHIGKERSNLSELHCSSYLNSPA